MPKGRQFTQVVAGGAAKRRAEPAITNAQGMEFQSLQRLRPSGKGNPRHREFGFAALVRSARRLKELRRHDP
jgi:hypothetical protein